MEAETYYCCVRLSTGLGPIRLCAFASLREILSDPATGVVLGGSIVGRNAAELISVIAVAVTNNLKVADIVDSLLVHPALAESLAEAAY